ncbi:hypothetical protein [Streptomyces sp. Root369]|uniref:hypothetical protein n=1 Tax=Streptomyces sp. Root369 TaxID=1736523 RepID=UPI00070AC3CB|nr:hypothetical protein [Streptomyces sp. Root369]KQW13545.1 hypothetical protein ASD08_30745 [Streptomyces sp. Root369]
MSIQSLIEDINLVAEAGDASDARDLARKLVREGDTATSIKVRRTVTGENLDRSALRAIGQGIARMAVAHAEMFTPQMIEGLYAVEVAMRESVREQDGTPSAVLRADSAARWTANQRRAERVASYNQTVEKVNRARGRARNERQAAAVRSKTCTGCFEVFAVNGSCGC